MSHAPRPPSALSHPQFLARFGGVYEASPWVAEGVWPAVEAGGLDDPAALAAAMRAEVDAAPDEIKLALIRAHPQLASRARMADASVREQAGAGLDQCSPAEFAAFQRLNDAYNARFGFPFIVAVKGLSRSDILQAFEQRLGNDPQTEFATAIAQIHRIGKDSALLTSSDLFDDLRRRFVDLAQPRLASAVVYATDDFFADKARLISPAEPVFVAGKYDENGKWMDGWESRRKRVAGHDWCVVKLGVPGVVAGFEIDTRHFTGNYPPGAMVEVCRSDEEVPQAGWTAVTPKLDLKGDDRAWFAIEPTEPVTHVRLHIYPDGGVARLRVWGRVVPDFSKVGGEAIDLLAMAWGGRGIIANDEHFGRVENLTAPGRGVDMGDGWETRRRREPGHDWAVLELGAAGVIEEVTVDTAHFKGNFPDSCSIQAAAGAEGTPAEIAAQAEGWPVLLPEVKLAADAVATFRGELAKLGPVRFVRLNIYPDGGVSRLRVVGKVAT